MALTTLTTDVSFISKLDNDPSDDAGMTPTLLKERFDAGSNAIKEFINSTLIPQLDTELSGKLSNTTLQSAIDSALSEAQESGDFDGREVELRKSGEYIQWRYAGGEWVNLVALTDIKGATGATGATGSAATVSIGTVTTGAAGTNASVTNSGTSAAAVLTFTIPQGAKGDKGDTGAKGDKGDTGSTGAIGAIGATGKGISSIVRTNGTGAAGAYDTYTITYSDNSTSAFSVYNGADGEGSGDMLKSIYDPNNKFGDAFNLANMLGDETHRLVTDTEKTTWNAKLSSSLKGAANGLAELDASSKVPSSQLPSYVDDVLESFVKSGATAFSSGWLSTTDGGNALSPENGKIYVVLSSGDYQNKTYRWGGSSYVEISQSLVLGETSATAYRGDRGKTAYDHSQSTSNPHSTTYSQVGAAASSHGHAASSITAGTLGGQVNANTTAETALGTAQVRDISAGTTDLTAGTSSLTTGAIYIYYT